MLTEVCPSFLLSFLPCVGYFLACMYLHHMHAVPQSSDKGLEFHGTRVIDGGTSLCGYREPNLDPLEEQPGLLPAEPSLQPVTAVLVILPHMFTLNEKDSNILKD